MLGQPGYFDLTDRYAALSKAGDPLERLGSVVDFEVFRGPLIAALRRSVRGKGGRPPFDPVAMFKVLILQAQHNLSDARMEFMIRDRLSWMRFLGFALGDQTPDENTIRHFRNRMTETGTLKRVMKAFDWQLHKKGYIPMSGQIVDASLVPAPKQRNSDAEKEAIKSGKTAAEIWPDEPNKAAQKDIDARWTLKIGGKVRYREDGTPLPMIAIPVFGYKSHISIDRRYGFIRAAAVTSAAHPDGRMLRQVIDRQNTGSEVWADTAYRSQGNEAWLADRLYQRPANVTRRDSQIEAGVIQGWRGGPAPCRELLRSSRAIRHRSFAALLLHRIMRTRAGDCCRSRRFWTE